MKSIACSAVFFVFPVRYERFNTIRITDEINFEVIRHYICSMFLRGKIMKKPAIKYCTNYNAIMYSTPNVAGIRYLARARCKQWTCEYCSEINARMWRAHILDNVNRLTVEGCRWSMLTMTARGGVRGVQTSYKQLQGAFRSLTEFWRKLHRDMGMPVPEYARVYEQHKDGVLHLHAIVMHYLPLHNLVAAKATRKPATKNVLRGKNFKAGRKYRIKDLTAMFGAGYMSDLQEFDRAIAPIVAGYVTKYMTKDIQSFVALPFRFRRVQTSQGFTTFGDMGASDLAWERLTWLSRARFEADTSDRTRVKDINRDEYVTTSDFLRYGVYPPAETGGELD